MENHEETKNHSSTRGYNFTFYRRGQNIRDYSHFRVTRFGGKNWRGLEESISKNSDINALRCAVTKSFPDSGHNPSLCRWRSVTLSCDRPWCLALTILSRARVQIELCPFSRRTTNFGWLYRSCARHTPRIWMLSVKWYEYRGIDRSLTCDQSYERESDDLTIGAWSK